MLNFTLQSIFTPNKRLLLIVLFFIALLSNAQNLLSSNNNNPGFEGVGGFQSNGYTDISPGTSGASLDGNYALTGSSGPMNMIVFNNVSPYSGAKMMVVDANNEIFWRQNPNIQLQGGVKYTFSYWVVNINKNGTSSGAFPNPVIQFTAADQCSCTPVLKAGSAAVNNATWQQVVYEFTPSGTGTKWVRIELSTPAASPNGNDFAIDALSLTAPDISLGISTPLDSTGADNAIVAYPNPVDSILHIAQDSAVSNYRITSVLGAVVKEGKSSDNSIDVSDLSSGLYYVQLRFENGEEHIQKIIKK